MKNYISFDVGGTKVKHAVLNEIGEIKEKNSYSTNKDELEKFIGDMLKIIGKYREKYNISGIGISLPGFVDPSTGYTEKAGAIDALHGKNLKEILEVKTKLKVEVENDANCVALAEKYSGNAVGSKDFVCVTVGTGIGGAIVVNDKLLYGHNFRGGEIGFMMIREDSDGLGSISQNSSTRSLINEYKKYKALDEEALVEGTTVFEEGKKDEAVKNIIEGWYERLSTAIFNLAAILNPEKILVGGGISIREEFIETIKEHLNKNEYWKDIGVEVCSCKYRNDAGLIGAVYKFIMS